MYEVTFRLKTLAVCDHDFYIYPVIGIAFKFMCSSKLNNHIWHWIVADNTNILEIKR